MSNEDYFSHVISKLTSEIELDPQNKQAYFLRGNTYLDRGDLDNAIADYTSSAIELDPTYWFAYNNRGLSLWAMGERNQAASDYDRVRKLMGQ